MTKIGLSDLKNDLVTSTILEGGQFQIFPPDMCVEMTNEHQYYLASFTLFENDSITDINYPELFSLFHIDT